MRALFYGMQLIFQARPALRPRPFLLLNASTIEYVDKLFTRAKPADLPIEALSKPGLAVNLNSTKALGITISRPISMWAVGAIR